MERKNTQPRGKLGTPFTWTKPHGLGDNKYIRDPLVWLRRTTSRRHLDSVLRNESIHREGVAILLNKSAQRSLIGYNPISERINTARLRTQIGATTIIQIYAPTSASSEEEADSFYHQLQQVITTTPSKDILIIMGDFNAKVGADWESWNGTLGKFGLDESNDRRERLLNFCALNNLCITNTFFKQKKDCKGVDVGVPWWHHKEQNWLYPD